MSTNLYVGNLPYTVTESELIQLFSGFGKVEGVRIINDSASGKPKGYAFITMAERPDADKAARRLNGKDFQGRTLKVSEARRKKDRPAAPSPHRGRGPGAAAKPQVRFPSDWSNWRKPR
jgi:RNA recognition motif-containing protein